ncbi:MAG: acyl-CoA dehydrogenase family protein, partial [Gammaproteobacteria bacterium]|nr:acyl-CoA dehydrogenase family protein [Gammaproteobacteria bacterium]
MPSTGINLSPVVLPDYCQDLRQEVRAFIAEELANGSFEPKCDAWLTGSSPEFSQKMGAKGWLGMTWPKAEGGHGRTPLERFVVTEELLQAGAPVACHWVADRQSGPSLLKFGNETLKKKYLPAVVRGECYFAIGMSEPNTGSDLASVQTRGEKVDGGWRVSGTKLWTSQAHISHAFILLARTEPLGEARHAGLTQFVIDLDAPGITINPVRLLTGEHHFNEVVLDNVFVPDEQVLGNPGDGWKQVTSELAYERSGPERFLSTY